ncbi:COG3650 family protein [Novosphingobium kaempferiae]|uniref:COG3650 family protein n=1 Tax=Novosphingobium kaempferiae TaxID=2896849 RepID=UPI001E5B9533|nr:hypothetical protein [Novosphingobium kaempferiae]
MPGDAADHRPWNGITAQETVHFMGTEPFWNGTVGPRGLTYATPGDEKGETAPVTRFAGRGGVSFSGVLSDKPTTLVVTPGECSDGMSDARYPFIVTLRIGETTLKGCGWTDREPRSRTGG